MIVLLLVNSKYDVIGTGIRVFGFNVRKLWLKTEIKLKYFLFRYAKEDKEMVKFVIL